MGSGLYLTHRFFPCGRVASVAFYRSPACRNPVGCQRWRAGQVNTCSPSRRARCSRKGSLCGSPCCCGQLELKWCNHPCVFLTRFSAVCEYALKTVWTSSAVMDSHECSHAIQLAHGALFTPSIERALLCRMLTLWHRVVWPLRQPCIRSCITLRIHFPSSCSVMTGVILLAYKQRWLEQFN